jgi:hypothetical protein
MPARRNDAAERASSAAMNETMTDAAGAATVVQQATEKTEVYHGR